jgi:hypothetical protein
VSGIQQIRYKRYDPSGAWDYGSSEVTFPADGSATRPGLVAFHPTIVSLLYLGFPSGSAAWFERRRDAFAPGAPTAVTPEPEPLRAVLAIGPNPLHGSGGLQLRWSGAAPADPRVAIIDVSGRRVAAVTLARDGGRWSASVPGRETSGWPAGVYFARLGASGSAVRFVVLR